MARTRVIANSRRYGFAVGRVRVLETRFLKRSHFERLLDAQSLFEQKRILSETVYGGYLESVKTAEDIEIALDKSLGDLYADFLESANLPDEIVAYFRTQHDFENLRGMLKAEALGIPVEDLLNDLGNMPAELFVSGELSGGFAAVAKRVRNLVDEEDGGPSADLLDTVVDGELYTELGRIAEESSNEHVRQLSRFGADMANIKIFIRLRSRSVPATEAERFYVPGGTITTNRFAELYRKSLAEAAAALAMVQPLRGIDPEALMDPSRFDVAVDSMAAKRLMATRMVPLGPEPVIAYVLLRRSEVAMLRTLLIGRIAGVDTQVLRSRMRDVA